MICWRRSVQEIEELQGRLAFQEDALQELTLTVVRQENRLKVLEQELERLKILVRELERNQPAPGSASQERPPHY